MDIFVREFLESDREALRDLFVSARSEAFSWVPSSEHKLEDFDTSTKGERILVATDAYSPIGFASIWETDSFLHNLFVHPEFQARGVGKVLLACCEKYFSGVPTLKCLKVNELARLFYRSQGWVVRSESIGPDGPYVLMERVGPVKITSNSASGPDAVKPRRL